MPRLNSNALGHAPDVREVWFSCREVKSKIREQHAGLGLPEQLHLLLNKKLLSDSDRLLDCGIDEDWDEELALYTADPSAAAPVHVKTAAGETLTVNMLGWATVECVPSAYIDCRWVIWGPCIRGRTH